MVSAVRFGWAAAKGTRLRPWRSEYLRWRMETYSGIPAKTLTARDFLRLAVTERRQLGHFCRWMGEMHELAKDKEA